MSMHRHPRRRRGFTLIELLVAISILAIVAVLGWRGLDSIVRARVALTRDMEQTRGIQLAFAQMQNDCAQLADTQYIGNRRTLAVEPQRITLIRGVYAENQPSRMQVVAYRLRDGQLTRAESPATRDVKELDSMWQAALGDAGTGLSNSGNNVGSNAGNSLGAGVVLQSSVAAMTVQSWFSDVPGWRAADAPAPNAQPTTATPAAADTAAGAAAAPVTTTVPIGLQVALQLRDRTTSMNKIFLLGAT